MEGLLSIKVNDKFADLDRIFTVKEVAEYLKVDKRVIYEEISEGKLKSVSVKGSIRVPLRYLYQYMYGKEV